MEAESELIRNEKRYMISLPEGGDRMPANAGPDPSTKANLRREAARGLALFMLDDRLDQTLQLFTVFHSRRLGSEMSGELRGSAMLDNRSVVVWVRILFTLSALPDECREFTVSAHPHSGDSFEDEDSIFKVDLSRMGELLQQSHPQVVNRINQLVIGLRARVLGHYVRKHVVRRK
jgi:hypothetical protein